MNEHRERLEAMADDNGQTWGLSDNDKAAIRWALAEIDRARPPGIALDWVWLDKDYARGRGAETILRGMYELIREGDDADATAEPA